MPCRISRRWKLPYAVWGLFVLETPFTIALLALFGIAAPNLYRKLLWQEGSDHGWNSDPTDQLYAMANYKPYHMPLVWSQYMTNFNLVISVLSMFLLLTKSIMMVVNVFAPFISIIVHGVLVALYAIAIHNQTAADTTNPAHPNNGPPWYITRSCSVSSTKQIKGYCQQAKASFIVTVCMLAIFAAHLPLAIYSIIRAPPPKPLPVYQPEPPTPNKEQPWIPLSPTRENGGFTPRTPATPRTRAYYSLGGEPTAAPGPGPTIYEGHQSHHQSPYHSPHQSPTYHSPLQQHFAEQLLSQHGQKGFNPPEKVDGGSGLGLQQSGSPQERVYSPAAHQRNFSNPRSPSVNSDLPLRSYTDEQK